MSRKRESPAKLAAGATGRRSIRFRGYDYSHSGAYFVTVCAARRGPLFGGISDGRVVENANAKIVRDCWLDLPNHYPHVSLDAFVMMPDHMHGIIVLLDPYEAGLTSGADWAGLKPAPSANRPLHPKPVQGVPHRIEISAAEVVHVNEQRVEAVQVAARLEEGGV